VKILNRQNQVVDYDEEKLFNGILNAAHGTREENGVSVSKKGILESVLKKLEQKTKHPTTVDINCIIPQVLMDFKWYETAENFIRYATIHKLQRANHKIDPITTIDEYVYKRDWRIKANANQGYSVGGMILNTSGKIVANYWFNNVYPEDAGYAHRNGDIHLHDSDCLMGYCAGWSLKTLLNEGFNGVDGKIQANPPKNFSAAIGQMVNFLGTLQNEWAGAQAFSSFDTYLAPFVRKLRYELEDDFLEAFQLGCHGGIPTEDAKNSWVEKRLRKEVMQQMQEFIYNLNVPSRWGTQTPFTNVTFDIKCPDELKPQVPMIGGVKVTELDYFKGREFTYGDLEDEMILIAQSYFEIMSKGDAKGQIFTFPIPTLNISKDFNWDDKRLDILWEAEAKYGLAYFQNFVNSDLNPNQIRSMCCRLQLDLRELEKRGNGLFGSAEQTGSLGVVTINCARLGYLHKGDKEGLYNRLDILLDLCKKALEAKRKFLTDMLNNGFYPYTKRYLGSYRNHFNTIGVNGINEMLLNFNGTSTADEEGIKFAKEFLDHIRMRLVEFQQETGNLYNLEATPGEGTCYRFAKEDKKQFGDDIIQAGEGEGIYYNNSSQLPVGFTDDMFEALDLQNDLQKKYTGGTVLHLFLGERVPTGDMAKNIIRKVFENYTLPYITLTPTFSVCPKHGYLAGEHKYCPICDQELVQKAKPDCNCLG
jgi:ribonucleoside-triphosphate reductase